MINGAKVAYEHDVGIFFIIMNVSQYGFYLKFRIELNELKTIESASKTAKSNLGLKKNTLYVFKGFKVKLHRLRFAFFWGNLFSCYLKSPE